MRSIIKVVSVFLMMIQFKLAHAQTTYDINSKQKLCASIEQKGFFQKKLLYDENSRLAFRNLPGPLNRGVCWWHSRFTRAATYLTIFRPDIQQKPKPWEIVEILHHIRRRDGVVEIPGYNNLIEFSRDNKTLIEEELNRWSIIDAFNFNMLKGIEGDSEEDPQTLESMMEDLYHMVKEEGRIVFQTLQLPGFSAHAWLVVDMERTSAGFVLSVVDSNYLEVRHWLYSRGQTQFNYYFADFLPVIGPFVPYANTDWQIEENRIIETVKYFCRHD